MGNLQFLFCCNRIGGLIGKMNRKNISMKQLVLRAKQRNIPVAAETLLYTVRILSKEARKALSELYNVYEKIVYRQMLF